jgi:hypothetical protein
MNKQELIKKGAERAKKKLEGTKVNQIVVHEGLTGRVELSGQPSLLLVGAHDASIVVRGSIIRLMLLDCQRVTVFFGSIIAEFCALRCNEIQIGDMLHCYATIEFSSDVFLFSDQITIGKGCLDLFVNGSPTPCHCWNTCVFNNEISPNRAHLVET